MTTVDIGQAQTRQAMLESLDLYDSAIGDPTREIYRRFYLIHPEAVDELAFDITIENRMMGGILALLVDVADGSRDAGGSLYWVSDHVAWDVTEAMIMNMFDVVRETIRDGLGERWTAEMAAGWAEVIADLAPATHDAVDEYGGLTLDRK